MGVQQNGPLSKSGTAPDTWQSVVVQLTAAGVFCALKQIDGPRVALSQVWVKRRRHEE